MRAGSGKREHYLKAEELVLEPGDEVVFEAGGGGGYGPPAERDRKAVAKDSHRGYISKAAAEPVYGFDAARFRS